MAASRKPGPIGLDGHDEAIDEGTLCRNASPLPGPVCVTRAANSGDPEEATRSTRAPARLSVPFSIVIERQQLKDGLVVGTIAVNGQSIGQTYENQNLKIPAMTYQGTLRYSSNHHFVQGPGGAMAMRGDFLIEVGNVRSRTDILLHTGNKPRHSAGCILLGPIRKDDTTGNYFVGDQDPLRKLRLLFYGTDYPTQCPNKEITITILEAPHSAAEAAPRPAR